MNTVPIGHFVYSTHLGFAFRAVESSRVHCVKHSERGFEWDFFEESQEEHMNNYMLEDLPQWRYGFEPDR